MIRENLNNKRRGFEPVRQAAGASGAGGGVRQFIAFDVSSKKDYLRCKTLTGNAIDGFVVGEEIIAVARPPELRQSTYDGFLVDGFFYSYDGPNFRGKTRESDDKTEIQVIVPAYLADGSSDVRQIIYAARVNTGLFEEDEVGPIADLPIRWQDQNVAGRAWTKKRGS